LPWSIFDRGFAVTSDSFGYVVSQVYRLLKMEWAKGINMTSFPKLLLVLEFRRSFSMNRKTL